VIGIRWHAIACVAALIAFHPFATGQNAIVEAKQGDSVSTPSPALLDELRQWKISGPANPSRLLPKSTFDGPLERNYTLKNKRVRKFLQGETQSVGINLGWTDDAEPATAAKVTRWFFVRNGGGDGPLTYGETIAIGVGAQPSFIQNKERAVGINLDWSETPVFEWTLAGGPAGQAIDPNKYLAIYNAKAEEFLIFFDRTAGADIGWPSSMTWGDQLKGELLKQAKKAALQALLAAAAE
jgi:hypothetical protein